MSKNVTHLFKDFQPSNYLLEINPDRASMTIAGSVTIKGRKTGRPSQRLTFHQKGLKILSATIVFRDKKGEKIITPSRINNQERYDEVRLHTEEMLYPGNYEVTMEYSGVITKPMEGIYPCTFEEDGIQKQLIATQFESHHAREAFPCIDEPEAKATFDLTITSPLGETVLANTPIKLQVTIDGSLVTAFETTPKMSTYLLAFVYGELGHKEATTKDGVLVRAFATPENAKHVDFALDVAVKTLEFYNDYFDIPYPLQKCDMIALPDFASGAMENWGLVTYREQCMLVDPANTSLTNKQYVAMVVAHELAHQWFGNLVTMRWWTDLWLNEGFASWIEYLAVDNIFPEWDMWTQFNVDEQEQGMRLDALEHTHPIEVAINHPDEIRTIFDAISYSKGSSVIHMLHEYLGASMFRDGLRFYLKKHAYSNTDTVDLWAALEEVSGRPVKNFMHAWTSQPGYPIVRATVSEGSMQLSQKRFQLNPAATPDDATWPVPLLSSSLDTTDEDFSSPTISYKTNQDLVLINSKRSGFYRTVYNMEHLELLGAAVKENKLSALDRVALLSDHVESAKSGDLTTTDVLELLNSYRGEDNSVVWDMITSFLGSTKTVMNDDELRGDMKPYVRTLVAIQLERLGWEEKKGESHFDTLLRPTILGLAASSDEPAVMAEITKRFAAAKNSEDIAPDLRGVIYNTVARTGDQAVFDKLLGLYTSSKSSEERVTLAGALTGFEDSSIIPQALALITTESVRLQDISYWIAYSFMNRFARDATWDWMVAQWSWLEANIGKDLSFYRMPIYAGRSFSTLDALDRFKDFFEPKRSPATSRSIDQAIEMIQWQSAWRSRDKDAVKQFFAQ